MGAGIKMQLKMTITKAEMPAVAEKQQKQLQQSKREGQ